MLDSVVLVSVAIFGNWVQLALFMSILELINCGTV